MKRSPLPPKDFLDECFEYNPETGSLTWKTRPAHHFASVARWRAFNTRFAGKPALNSPDGQGYLRGSISYHGKATFYRQHRVIWKLMTGEDPVEEIDHKDLDRSNNRWSNLREATRSENFYNKPRRRDNQSGFKGVSPHRDGYTATIRVRGRRHYLGRFSSAEEAHKAYTRAAEHLHGKYSRTT